MGSTETSGGPAAELERVTAALRRSEHRFRDVIERNADAIVVVDRSANVCFANAAAERLFGKPRELLVGSPFGLPLVAGETTELDLVRPGQEPAVVELRVVESEWEAEPAFIASLRDVTERKRAEEAARRLIAEQARRTVAEAAARRFSFLAESAAVLSEALDYDATLAALARLCTAELADWAVVFCADPDGRIRHGEVAHRDASRLAELEQLRDAPVEPFGRHPVFEVMSTCRPLLLREVAAEHLRAMAESNEHLRLLEQLGVASLMLVPLVARGRSLGAIGLVSSDAERLFGDEDMDLATDLAFRAAMMVDNARLLREAKEANRTKTDLLAVVSHDLRTPLNSIMGYAELLSLGLPDPLTDGSRESVERIRAGAKHLLHLIDELLAFARIESGHQELHLADVDLGAIVREVGELVAPLAAERGLDCQVRTPAEPVALSTDPDKLRQVLMNLAANALKFTTEGYIRLELSDAPDAVVIAVEDSGCGIAEQDVRSIFAPFWQAESARASGGKGVGLGLSVVERLVRMLGGDIVVSSEIGRGSSFRVRLPRPGEQPAQRAAASEEEAR